MREGARRNGVLSGIKKWPNARIPYAISSEYNERERAVLARAFQEYHTRTCVRFSPRTAFDRDYLYIGKIDGCFSDVGRAGGRQELSLDHGCLQYDTAIHELMHSVGFFHEHERWDRDNYITILWHNIDEEAYDQFGKVDLSESSYYGQPYDYHSIMHYDSLAFSKNGLETLIAKRSEMTLVMGSAVDFSTIDLAKINQMYSCSMRTRSMFSQPDLIDAHLIAMDTRRSVASTQLLSESRRECRDRSNLCWRWLNRCRSIFFENVMREFCSRSCHFCTTAISQIIRPTSTSQSMFALGSLSPIRSIA
uniref:Metalloendopeptidase n=1 Tax=Ascaris suum TaxID=6253 RepID=F1L7S1_ASCSU